MCNSNGESSLADQILRPFMKYAAEYTQKIGELGLAAEGLGETQCTPAQQREWLDSASKDIDEYLRSPDFLQLLKSHIDTLIELRERASAMQLSDAGLASEEFVLQAVDEADEWLQTRLLEMENRIASMKRRHDNLEGDA